MPTNFYNTVETQGAPDVTSPREYSSNAGLIEAAGKAVGDLAGLFQKDKGEERLGRFATEITDIEAGVARYANRQAELTAELDFANENTIRSIKMELEKLRKGQMQGMYSPTQARLKVATLVKSYSGNFPGLAKDIRVMANQVTGNFNESINEALGIDPFIKGSIERYNEARGKGMSTAEYFGAERARVIAEGVDRELKQRTAVGALEKTHLVNSGIKLSQALTTQEYVNIVQLLDESLRVGEPLTSDTVKGVIANANQNIQRNIMDMVAGNLNPDIEWNDKDFDVVLRGARETMKNLETFLTARPELLDNAVKLLKLMNEQHEGEDLRALYGDDSSFGKMLVRFKSAGLQSLIPMVVAASLQADFLDKKFAGDPEGRDRELQRQRDVLLQSNQPEAYFAAAMADAYRKNGAMTDSAARFLLGQDYRNGNKYLDAQARQLGHSIYEGIPQPEERLKLTGTLLSNVTWNQLVRNKTLASDVSKMPELRAEAIGKATAYVLSTLADRGMDVNAVDFDPLRGINAFGYKNNLGFSSEKNNAILELNRTYRDILSMFGSEVATDWVRGLVSPNTQHGIDTAFGLPAKKKVDLTKGLDIGESMSHVIQLNREKYGLPEALVLAIGDKESTLGKNLGNPKSTAKGPMAIIDDTFNSINAKYFNGQLDPNNMNDRGEASLALLAELNERHGGDTVKMLLEYFSGDPNGWGVVDAFGTRGDRYVIDVLERMRKFSG